VIEKNGIFKKPTLNDDIAMIFKLIKWLNLMAVRLKVGCVA